MYTRKMYKKYKKCTQEKAFGELKKKGIEKIPGCILKVERAINSFYKFKTYFCCCVFCMI